MLAFTRTKHRANRLAEYLAKHGVKADRIHGNRSQAQRTAALAGFKDGRFQVLVATDIAARGHRHRCAEPRDQLRRARACRRTTSTAWAAPRGPRRWATPSRWCRRTRRAICKGIERAVGTRFSRVRLPGFDYTKRPADRLEIPLAERIASIRARKAEDRQRARVNAERRAQHGTPHTARAGR